jgi:hypothetical protein
LKVLVVINGCQWSIEDRRDELEEKVFGRVVVYIEGQLMPIFLALDVNSGNLPS